MVIELRGVNSINKGAELMMLAIISKIKEELRNPLFVMEKSKLAPPLMHSKYGIYTKTNFKRFKIPFKYFLALIPAPLRRRWYYINENEIDVVLDASGFALGDTWGVKKASRRLGNHIEKWNRGGKKVIILPQAFGPFATQELITCMETIINYADLIFARDQISFKYLKGVAGNNEKFILAPDFTNLIDGISPPYLDNLKDKVAIVVNNQMIKTNTKTDGEAYLHLLRRIIMMIEKLDYKPYFLIQEGQADRKIAELINQKLITRLAIVEEDNPLYIKGIIAGAKAVVTSRFHGLVNCLSQAIPCLATGWSHKYEMLLQDYNYQEAFVNIHCNDELLLEKVKSILTETTRKTIIDNLKAMSLNQKKLSEEMWTKVLSKIRE
ncbi:MAG: polysaccharide pyruvyl transferase family protein [Ginsengibacter sp.]